MKTDAGKDAEMRYDTQGVEILLAGRSLGRIESGVARLITNKTGVPLALVGISEQPQNIMIRFVDQKQRQITVRPNQRIMI
jgi:hypothetical protein